MRPVARHAALAAFALAAGAGCTAMQPSDRDVTITIRNEWEEPAILSVMEAPDEASGPPGVIAPAIHLEPGETRTVRIQAPAERWALGLANGDRGFLYSSDLARASREADPGEPHVVISPAGIADPSDGPVAEAPPKIRA